MSLLRIIACLSVLSGQIASTCKSVVVDEADPATIQLAQLEAIRCLIETSARQHSETLSAIQSISVAPPSRTNFYDVLIVLITSVTFIWLMRLVVKTGWYCVQMKSRRVVELLIAVHQVLHVVGLANRVYATVDDYRSNLTPPWTVKCYRCLQCRQQHDPGVLEI